MRLLSAASCAAWLLACGTPRVLPPRSAPAASMPHVTLPAEPPAAGLGRLVIDAVDGPMDVTAQTIARFAGASTAPVRVGPLCRTPCAVDLPYGRYRLYLSGLASDPSRGDVLEVEVHEGLTVLRRAPGKYETPEYLPAGPFALAVSGTIATGAGAVLLGVDADSPAPGVLLVTGGLGLTIAALITWPHRAEQQAGTSTTFRAPPAAAPPAAAPPAAVPAPATETVGSPDPTVPAPSTAEPLAAPPSLPSP